MLNLRSPKVFNHKLPMVYLRPFGRCDTGTPVRRMHLSRLRRWFRAGIIGYADEVLKPKKTAPKPGPVELAENTEAPEEAVETEEAAEPMPVKAVEGKQGWWTVTFSDGGQKKMRRDDVVSLGLLEGAVDDEAT